MKTLKFTISWCERSIWRFMTILIFTGGLSFIPFSLFAAAQVRAVGSSTVYPYATVVAEYFSEKTGMRTPIIESTGTGGGIKLFCSGLGIGTPDIVNASRTMKESERNACNRKGIDQILEVKIGHDGIVMVQSLKAKQLALTRKEIFLALARIVPVNGELKPNPYHRWSDINPTLPREMIEIYGPPPTSGTRDAFVELVMEKACEEWVEFRNAYPVDSERKKQCAYMREDGKYIETGENDNLIIQKLTHNLQALGITGYSYMEENSTIVQSVVIDSVLPTVETILSGRYVIARPLYMYFKKQHWQETPSLLPFLREIISEEAIGKDGYLAAKGLIPLTDVERSQLRSTVKEVLQDLERAGQKKR